MQQKTREFVLGILPEAKVRGYSQAVEHEDLRKRLESNAPVEGFAIRDLQAMKAAIESVIIKGEYAKDLIEACDDLDAEIKARKK